MFCKLAVVSFCKLTLTFFELRTTLTKDVYKNMYCTGSLVQLLMRGVGKEPVEKYFIVLHANFMFEFPCIIS